MKGINKVIIVGTLGKDPETRYLTSGKAVTNISVATSESWKDKQTGQPQEKTEWHRIVLFDRLAEIAGEYLKKGSQVYIEGRIVTRKWQDESGQDRYSTEITANQMQMLGGKQDSEAKQQVQQLAAPPRLAATPQQAPQQAQPPQGQPMWAHNAPQYPQAGPDVGDGIPW